MMETMRIQNIEFKSLSLDDLQPGLLDSFNRFQRVTRVWRTVEGERQLVDAPFIDNWDAATKNEIIAEDFHRCLHYGGKVICAVHNGQIAAFAALLRELFGSSRQYADLMQLHVSTDFRHAGLGRSLFMMAAQQAEAWGAQKLYISAHSAEETQAFYRAMGCVDAVEINAHHVALEPFDIQMEYVIGRNKNFRMKLG
ncbi:Acetyltransferase (GNAT) domain-containing protein [Paenibacillus jilunlii]|uniref:Acetyltransferase (GNAT) domain-containing protein n=2 Tax=Paenibacillus jilunlii TaxID=682956 RepID=A0A1G9NE74_9BACL|nr:Acetyltransferase (GNAT) domain-containing protein [Paenibacillus jilunlii]